MTVDPKNQIRKMRESSKTTGLGADYLSGIGEHGTTFSKHLISKSNNPKSLNNGLGSQVAKENAGNTFNVPKKKRTLM